MIRALSFVVGVVVCAGCAGAGVILGGGFFQGKPTTVIDFEKDGSGVPLGLADGDVLAMPAGEYAGQGVTFDPAIVWVNDGALDFEAATAAVGSLEVTIGGGAPWSIVFSVPVRAVGLAVINNNTLGDPISFTAFDAGDTPLGSVDFTGAAIDGTVGVADYGFMGLYAETEIARLEILGSFVEYDDLTFSELPAPGVIGAMGVAGVCVGRRRRR